MIISLAYVSLENKLTNHIHHRKQNQSLVQGFSAFSRMKVIFTVTYPLGGCKVHTSWQFIQNNMNLLLQTG
jgi:hypothetical protein